MQNRNVNHVTVIASGRLHAALLNESGYLNRIDGGIGFAVGEPNWRVTVFQDRSLASYNYLSCELQATVERVITKLEAEFDIQIGVALESEIPEHVGLGSKTALLMGIGNAVNSLFKLKLTITQIAALVGRGGTSGIGIWTSKSNGFLWDSGRQFPEEKSKFEPSNTSLSRPPNLLCTVGIGDFSICHFRFSNGLLHGKNEQNIFKSYCPFPESEAIVALSLVAGGVLPGLLDNDETLLQRSLLKLQENGLKKIEWAHQDEITKDFRTYWRKLELAESLCLSSMGPTMFCLTRDSKKIRDAVMGFTVCPLHFNIST